MLAKFTGLKMPTFDDYISDLSILFETYPTKGGQQLHDVRKAMALIDELEKVADKLPELPRDKEVKDDEIDRKAKELSVLSHCF